MDSVELPEEADLPYALAFDSRTNTLFGIVKPPPPPPRPMDPESDGDSPAMCPYVPPPIVNAFSVRQHIEQMGYAGLLFPTPAISDFVKSIKENKTGKYPLGERRDGFVELAISDDKNSVTIKTTQSWGGSRVTREEILDAIDFNKISEERLLQEPLKELCANPDVDASVVVAQSLPYTPGEDARLEQLLESQQEKAKDSDAEGTIDLREVFSFLVVEAGHKLMRKIPATLGKNGKNVFGQDILARPGKDIAFAAPFVGVEISPEDENLMVASTKGHPVFSNKGVKVDPILTLKAVNIHSGNIDYDGSINIQESIEAGYVVNATGDIHVQGQVERANLEAGGNIVVKGGILGEDDENSQKCLIHCEGNLNAKFLNHAVINCEASIIVEEYIMQSRIHAKNEILVGQQKGRGCIIGGYCSSDKGIRAKSVGSEAYVPTSISVGMEEEENQELNTLHQEQDQRSEEKDKLATILHKVKTTTKASSLNKTQLEKIRKIHNTIVALENRIEEIDAAIRHIESQKKENQSLKIHVSGVTWPNATITIKGKSWHCEKEQQACTYMRRGKMIQAKPLEKNLP